VARWLRYWLAQAEPHLRPSTVHGYRDHIDRYLIPSLGRITLADLAGRRLQACFDLLSRQRTKAGTLIAASTVDRVRATLRSALNVAVREGLIASNPQATADMVIKAARSVPGSRSSGTTVPHVPVAVTASGYCQT
jgi:integrase-like protein